MDNKIIESEVMQAEANLLTALREGELLKGVSMHLNSPDYRNIWNGEIKTYEMLEARIKMGIEKGLKSIDYKVQSRNFSFINADIVLETLTATETTTMRDGSSATSGITAVTILWQRIDNKWQLGYLHASELPKEN
ncbi:MAG: nuclear transport factor 2 family protein [Chloroflexi bacterium]|nr:nuclear transport factor 2 family protein [Chloroflexota bacterium]